MSHAPNASGSSRRLVASVAIVALLLGAWHLTGEAAQARILSLVAGPSSVAVIDVQSVLSQLDERVKLEEDLGTLGSKLENEVNSLKAEADTLAEDLDVYDPSSAEFKAQRRKVEAATARWRIQGELANRVVLEERSDLQRLHSAPVCATQGRLRYCALCHQGKSGPLHHPDQQGQIGRAHV